MDKDVTIAARETNTIMFNNIVLDKTHGQVASCFTWTVTPYTLDVSFSIMSVTKRGPFMLGAEVIDSQSVVERSLLITYFRFIGT